MLFRSFLWVWAANFPHTLQKTTPLHPKIRCEWCSVRSPITMGAAGSAGGAGTRTNMHSGAVDDRNTITYISPKVNGIQVGASFTPTITTDTLVPRDATGGDGVRDNAWSLGATYSGSFAGDVGLKLSAGYTDGGNDDAATGDMTVFTAGIQVGFGGFTVSGAYGSENDDAAGENYNNFAASLGYNAGPMGVSVLYLTSKDDQQNDKQDILELGASYAMGPGVKAQASLYVVERTNAGNKAADGVAGVAGIRLDF